MKSLLFLPSPLIPLLPEGMGPISADSLQLVSSSAPFDGFPAAITGDPKSIIWPFVYAPL